MSDLDQWEAWIHSRCGKITASHVGDVLARPSSKRYLTYLERLRNERLTGMVWAENVSENRYMQAGQNLELNAVGLYSLGKEDILYHGCENPIFIISEELPFFGCSPDFLVGSVGVGEVKVAFNGDLQRRRMHKGMEGTQRGGGHMHQVHAQLLVTGREWVDMVSYCPHLAYPDNLYVQRVERDEEEIERLREAIIRFNNEVEAC